MQGQRMRRAETPLHVVSRTDPKAATRAVTEKLELSNGDVALAARRLRMGVRSLYRVLKKLGLEELPAALRVAAAKRKVTGT